MRISDWSSDVCSSDLWQDWTVTLETDEEATFKAGQFRTARPKQDDSGRIERPLRIDAADPSIVRKLLALTAMQEKIGRASCREECVSTCRSRWSPYH